MSNVGRYITLYQIRSLIFNGLVLLDLLKSLVVPKRRIEILCSVHNDIQARRFLSAHSRPQTNIDPKKAQRVRTVGLEVRVVRKHIKSIVVSV